MRSDELLSAIAAERVTWDARKGAYGRAPTIKLWDDRGSVDVYTIITKAFAKLDPSLYTMPMAAGYTYARFGPVEITPAGRRALSEVADDE